MYTDMVAENGEAGHFPSEYSIGSMLYDRMTFFRNRIAQYEDESDYVDTYYLLLQRCIRVAIKLQEMGIGVDDIVSACTHNHRDSCLPFVASTFIGAIPATFDPKLPPLDTVKLLRLIKPKLMFVSQDAVELMERCTEKANIKPRFVVFGPKDGKYESFEEFLNPSSKENDFKVYKTKDPKRTAVIMFSSGTTGPPKGICLNHYSLLKQSSLLTSNDGFRGESEDGVMLVYSTLYWISGVSTLVGTALKGEARVVCSQFDAARFWDILEKYKVTRTFIPPYYINEILSTRPSRKLDLSGLKSLMTGSTPVTAQQMKQLISAIPDAHVINGYGQTEVAGIISWYSDPKDHHFQKDKPTSCGKVLDYYQWKVVNLETEQPLGPNKKGELRVKSDIVFNGYYNVDSSECYDSEGYLRTGDIAYYDEENCLYVDDRVKEMFKFRGWHILPAIVEEVVCEHPAVKEAVVIGLPHGEDGEHPIALVVLKKDYQNINPEEIRKFVDQKVSEAQKLRAGVKIVNELLRTATGKVRRKAMREMVLDGSF